MTNNNSRPVLIDTNSYIRLFFSELRPLLLQNVDGHSLLTLEDLVNEFYNSQKLTQKYPWMLDPEIKAELLRATLSVSRTHGKKIQDGKDEMRRFSDASLRTFCNANNIVPVKSLSRRDLNLLVTAQCYRAVLVTDEWPLTYIAREIMEDVDEGDTPEIEVWNSLNVLHFLERNNALEKAGRVKTCRDWIRNGECLPRDWQRQYRELFGERAPRLNGG
ncbi:hypothetical protein [Nitrogeniibacter aestuarii]|uniref:hypothetical protein n=1 Tax=Nitrogeniibacter aestuarii TaxID=2815343 RepID=UPI001D10699F|nr:hypothetical protein [Nitrogeniibacter aestuarii]